MAIYDLLDPNKYVSKEELKERLRLCNSCPERLEDSKNHKLTKFSRCPECGCFINLKARLTTEECPLGDW
jgi:predicted RNA-binding Zn-ribbon protein involved in translation (DUF1610 family)